MNEEPYLVKDWHLSPSEETCASESMASGTLLPIW